MGKAVTETTRSRGYMGPIRGIGEAVSLATGCRRSSEDEVSAQIPHRNFVGIDARRGSQLLALGANRGPSPPTFPLTGGRGWGVVLLGIVM